jgi:NADH dehydrogenase
VTLIARTNYHLFQPLLYQVAGGLIEPGTVATPIRSLLRGQKNVTVQIPGVAGVDKDTKRVRLDVDRQSLQYDYLVLATGSRSAHDWLDLCGHQLASNPHCPVVGKWHQQRSTPSI